MLTGGPVSSRLSVSATVLRSFVLLFLFFYSIPGAEAQVTPTDSTANPGGGRIKVTQKDTSAVVVVPADTGRVKVTAADTTAGKNKSKNKEKKRRDGLFFKTIFAPKDSLQNGPRIAWRRSAILPGWGQIYNRSAWKVPIIYAGFAAFGYFIYDNHKKYVYFKEAHLCRVLNTNCPVPEEIEYYTDQNLRNARDFYRRYRDLNLILAVLFYGINIVDAFVEAHLDGFKISDDLSLRVEPFMNRQWGLNNASAGMGFTLTFGSAGRKTAPAINPNLFPSR